MNEKFKKLDRQYVLSDSTVNEYGFRLLTSGYQMDSFAKNPIGYYMHRREDGITLKWEDLKITDDKVMGTPVINLSNTRGAQTYDEAENGFLNAASVGHIVVLEYSTDKEMMLPGQTGPTITKWYNKECSLVDIPGNSNALTCLYDAQENVLNLADMGVKKTVLPLLPQPILTQLRQCLNLDTNATETEVIAAASNMAANTLVLASENATLCAEKQALQEQLDEVHAVRRKYEVTTLLNRALEDKKITVELQDKLASDYANNETGLKELLAAMPAYQSITEQLKSIQQDNAEAQWAWDDYEKNDPTGNKLKSLRAANPEKYKELFDKKFAA